MNFIKYSLSLRKFYAPRLILGILFGLLSALITPILFAAEPQIQMSVDRADSLYACGEQAQLTIAVTTSENQPAASGMLELTLTNDGGVTLGRYVFNLAETDSISLQKTLSFPGILQFKAVYHAAGEVPSADKNLPSGIEKMTSAAFSPLEITPSLPEPDDFADFVARSKKEVREIPIDVQMTPIESLSNDEITVRQISFATLGGQRLYGFLSMPKEITKPLPLIVSLPGAGPGHGPNLDEPKEGFAVLNMNVFPYPVALDDDQRNKEFNQYLRDLGVMYSEINTSNRETYFYRPVFFGADRAIDWLAEQDYIDASRIGYVGFSQGGGLGLILCSLNHRIRAAIVGVPAFCDQTATLAGRLPCMPRTIANAPNDSRVLETARYYDAINYARYIPKETSITVLCGLIDNVCPSSCIYAAFNVLPTEKKAIFPAPNLGHTGGPEYWDLFQKMKKDLKQN